MTTFSQHFGHEYTQYQLDFVDVDPEKDLPLYIDPFSLSLKQDEWSEKCTNYITSFFQCAIDSIRSDNHKKAKDILNNLSEPNEVCFGVSKNNPNGRGVSGKQAMDIYEKLIASKATKSGLLSELADCDLFIVGIGPDKISDITTNIIRKPLIDYTKLQCNLYEIPLLNKVPTGRLWDPEKKIWYEEFDYLPIINNRKIILVPKYLVRFKLCLDSREFYNKFVLNFLQKHHLETNSSLVELLKNGGRRVTKKKLKDKYPFNKDWMAQLSLENPQLLDNYKIFARNRFANNKEYDASNLNESLDESSIAKALIKTLSELEAGAKYAEKYHLFIIGCLEFIFWPNLIFPKKEFKIHEGRKRIDITYTNAAESGFFYRVHSSHSITSNVIMVECKNYNNDIDNNALDQLTGRFSVNRGKLGFLLFRETSNFSDLLSRCKDAVHDSRGVVIPLGDTQLIDLLNLISLYKRQDIDEYINDIFLKIIS